MVVRNKVEGKIYSFRSRTECNDLRIAHPDLEKLVTCHMVLVLNWVPQRWGYVKVMTISSKRRPVGECVPIAPTPKKPFPIQIKLQNGPEEIYRNMRIIHVTELQKTSYLWIDSSYEVPLCALKEVYDRFGNQLMQLPRRQGGIKELQSYVRSVERSQQRQDAQTEGLAYAFGQQSLKDDLEQVATLKPRNEAPT